MGKSCLGAKLKYSDGSTVEFRPQLPAQIARDGVVVCQGRPKTQKTRPTPTAIVCHFT
jgi:hypothetical protein